MENLSEEMRVLYVAFTRPKEKLIITGSIKDIDSSIKKWGEGIDVSGPVSEYQILKGKNFLDWIMPAVLKHKDSIQLREESDLDSNVFNEHDSKWETKIWNKSDVLVEKTDLEDDDSIENILLNAISDNEESEIYKIISEKLDYRYPFMESVTRAGTISVTEIKRLQSDTQEEVDYTEQLVNKPTELKKPKFIQEDESKDKLTGAQKGTILHLFMQIINLNKVNTVSEIKEEIELAIKKKILTQTQADTINPYKILKFFKSNLGKRMLKSPFVKREQAFYMQINLRDIFKPSEEFKDIENKDTLMVRGIIDTYFEEDNEIVLVDYKTDFVNEENRKEVIDRYNKQLEIYSKALEKLTGKKVKEAYIYLFGIEEEVLYKF